MTPLNIYFLQNVLRHFQISNVPKQYTEKMYLVYILIINSISQDYLLLLYFTSDWRPFSIVRIYFIFPNNNTI